MIRRLVFSIRLRRQASGLALPLVLPPVLPLVLTVLCVLVAPAARADDAALEQRLRALEDTIETLRGELAALRSESAGRQSVQEQRTEGLAQAVDVLALEMEDQRLGAALPGAESAGTGAAAAGLATASGREGRHGLAPAASKVYGVEQGVSIGGYGEMLFQSFDSALDDGSRSSRRDELDFLRAIVYFGYKFNDRILFNSEIEFEHASTGKKGEASVEFAYLDFLLRDELNFRAGLLLAPFGFVNELHEPPVFLGARRPQLEQQVIPTTWRENGIGLFGEAGRFSYRAYLLAGLDATGFSASSGLRGGRQKGSKSVAEDFALALRFDVEPVPGLLLGASGYFGDSGQDALLDGEELAVRTRLYDLHAQWRWRGLQLRGLWAMAELSDVAELDELLGLSGDDTIGERLEGWYGEIGWDLLAHRDTEQELIPFLRYETWDTQARVPEGFLRDPANDHELWTLGLSYKPHPNVVLKLDWQDERNRAGTGQDQLNFAVGFLF